MAGYFCSYLQFDGAAEAIPRSELLDTLGRTSFLLAEALVANPNNHHAMAMHLEPMRFGGQVADTLQILTMEFDQPIADLAQ